MVKFAESFTNAIIRWRYPLLLIGLTAAALSIVPARQLDFDRSIENMFASNDQYLAPYRELGRVFGGNEAILLVYRDEELLNPDGRGIERVSHLGRQVAKIDGISEVASLGTLDAVLGQLFDQPITADEGLAAEFRDLFINLTHSEDGNTAAIICLLDSDRTEHIPRQSIVRDIRMTLAQLPPDHPEVLITGEPVMVADGFQMVADDGQLLKLTSLILLSVVMLVSFRSLRWMLIPIAVVQATLLTTQALLVVADLRLSMVSSMFAAIITVIGVATTVHIIVRYREGLSIGLDRHEALQRAMRLLIAPITWACLTDAAGFTALTFASVGPIQDFGLMMAAGSVMVLVSVILLVPGLALLPVPRPVRFIDSEPQRAWSEGMLDQELNRPLKWVGKHPYAIAGGATILTATLCVGLFFANVESDFTKNFRADSELVRSYVYVESELGGAGVWDVMVPAEENLSWDYVQRVLRLEDRLRSEIPASSDEVDVPGVTKVLSLADALELAVRKIDQTSIIPLDRTPGAREVLVRGTVIFMQQKMPQLMESLYATDPDHPERRVFRLMLRSRERQTADEKKLIISRVEEICREEFPDNGTLEIKVTGFYVLLTHLVDSILNDQWKTFGIATLLIGIMMLLAFRHIGYAIAGLIPNILPILFVLGGLGWAGIKINMGTAMIAAVSIGLSIDSSIHYITSYRRARGRGMNVMAALSNVQQRVGRALCFATVALIAGFTTLCISEFVPTIYFGALVSLSMLGGLFGNLLVLPLLLSVRKWGDRREFDAESIRSEPQLL